MICHNFYHTQSHAIGILTTICLSPSLYCIFLDILSKAKKRWSLTLTNIYHSLKALKKAFYKTYIKRTKMALLTGTFTAPIKQTFNWFTTERKNVLWSEMMWLHMPNQNLVSVASSYQQNDWTTTFFFFWLNTLLQRGRLYWLLGSLSMLKTTKTRFQLKVFFWVFLKEDLFYFL